MSTHYCASIVKRILAEPIDNLEAPGVSVVFTPKGARAQHEYRVASKDKTWSITGYNDRLVLTIRVSKEAECEQIREALIALEVNFSGIRQLTIPFSSNTHISDAG
jgi:hypothetical protein